MDLSLAVWRSHFGWHLCMWQVDLTPPSSILFPSVVHVFFASLSHFPLLCLFFFLSIFSVLFFPPGLEGINTVWYFLHHLAFCRGSPPPPLPLALALSLLFMCIMKAYNHILHTHILSEALRLYVSGSKNNRIIIILMAVAEDPHHCCSNAYNPLCLSNLPIIS